ASLLVELTWFWGMAGTLQAVATPDLDQGFPHLVFFQYTAGHLAIVVVALYLVVGLRHRPRRRAAPRVLAITAAYTAAVGLVDWWTGADYMFLRSPPANWTLLSVLGPWPWYIFSATGVAVVLVTLLDAPFWPGRRRASESVPSGDRAQAAA
ncbi:MAG TPA: TIGR02206 family membrane protein, partial [Acidimicrobiales bacterium]|nr:TIGR02206 family membrane protein [Acidimicrobiales bacterium]